MSAANNVLFLDVIDCVSIGQPQFVVDPLHPGSVLGSKSCAIATEVDIQFFQRFILGLRYQKPHKESTAASKAGEEDVRSESHAVDHVTCGQANDEVELEASQPKKA